MSKTPKLEILPTTPSAEVVAKATAEVTVTDARGRVITLKKPGVLAQFRLVEALGDSAKNQTYLGMVLPLIFVTAIDGDPVYQPSKKSEVEALIQQLNDEGIEAVMNGVNENFGKTDTDLDKERLKNS
jgi:hypothetical protein